MKPQVAIAKPWSLTNTSLAADVRWELRNQLSSLSDMAQWTLLPVILLTASGIWTQIDTYILLIWSGFATAQILLGLINSKLNHQSLKQASDQGDAFILRNMAYFFLIGLEWGSLSLMTALWGDERASWFVIIVTLAILTALVVILSTSHRIFFAALTPVALLTISAIFIGPVYSIQMLMLGVIFIIVIVMMHNTLFQVHVDRVRSSLRNAAHASALANTLEHHDSLTGLYNKSGLQQWLRLYPFAEEGYASMTVALANVKGFSEINTLYGSSVADTLLIEIASRLVHKSGGKIGLARLSGAEFLLIDARPLSSPEDIRHLLASLEHDDFLISDRLVNINFQESHVQGRMEDIEMLIETARSRLQPYRGEPLGSGSDQERLQYRRELVTGFHDALANKQIRPWFQPIVDCKSNAIVGWEALVRWEHADLGVISPENFLDIARISGQSNVLTQTIFRDSATFARDLIDNGHLQAARVSINFTTSDLATGHTMDWIQDILAATKVLPQQLVIEISEKEALMIDDQFRNNLIRIQQSGIQLAIDDFGTGHANISRLLDLPASIVKLDKRFVDRLPHDKHSVALVRAIITMALSMGMKTVAEGVEREEQLIFLRNNGCDAYQGFHAGLAMPYKSALDLVGRWRGSLQPSSAKL